jgi:putative ABC transport system permease protein
VVGTRNKNRFRFWLWLIRAAGVIVPRRLRADWKQEWQAELQHREELLADWDRLSLVNKLDLARRSLGGFSDALWMQTYRWEDEVIQDIRFGIRILIRQPSFTAAAIVALALGTGASTAVFSVVNGVLLEPLPFNQPQRVVALSETNAKLVNDTVGASLPNFRDWRDQNQVFEALAAVSGQPMNWTGAGEPSRVTRQSVSADFFKVLGVDAALGRTLQREDESSGNAVVVLSNGFWQSRFGGDRSMLGKSLTLNNKAYTVVGVMPPGFRFLRPADLFTLLDLPPVLQQMRGAHFLQVIGRLKPGVTVEQARAGMDTVSKTLGATNAENAGWTIRVVAIQEQVVGAIRPVLLILMGAVMLVLLIACGNVAGLMLARGVGRQQEIAIRAALGAGKVRLIRQLLTESLMLSVLGGSLGLILAAWGIRGLQVLQPSGLPRLEDISINTAVLGFSIGLLLVTTLIFGLVPAWQSARVSFQEALKQGSPSTTRRTRSLDILVIGEVALSLVLLVGAGLLIRSFVRLISVDPGFEPSKVVSMQLSLPAYKYKNEDQQVGFYGKLLEQASALPDVEAAGLVNALPLSGDDSKNSFAIEGRDSHDESWASLRTVSTDYFHAMGIPIISGRPFSESDDAHAPPVVIINRAMANRYWSGEEAVGKRLLFGSEAVTIVGVVGDVRHENLETPAEPETYIPWLQAPSSVMTLVVRARTSPVDAIPRMRELVASIDKDQAIENVRTMEQWVSHSLEQRRSVMTLISLFSLLALVLAAVGIYGVMAHSVTRRTHEIGIRMALGATAGSVMKMVVGHGMRLMIAGILLGVVAALVLTGLMRSLLFSVGTTDPATFVGTALLLIGVSLAACYLPARRATKVDPLVALRHD